MRKTRVISLPCRSAHAQVNQQRSLKRFTRPMKRKLCPPNLSPNIKCCIYMRRHIPQVCFGFQPTRIAPVGRGQVLVWGESFRPRQILFLGRILLRRGEGAGWYEVLGVSLGVPPSPLGEYPCVLISFFTSTLFMEHERMSVRDTKLVLFSCALLGASFSCWSARCFGNRSLILSEKEDLFPKQ